MKRAIIGLTLTFASLSVLANPCIEPYFGVGVGAKVLQMEYLDSIKHTVKKPAIHAVVGAKVLPFLGFELGGKIAQRDTSSFDDSKVSIKSIDLKALGFVPVVDKFELVFGGGVGRYQVHLKADDQEKLSRVVPLMTAGGEYNFTDSVAVRAGADWQFVDKVKNKSNGIVKFSKALHFHTTVLYRF